MRKKKITVFTGVFNEEAIVRDVYLAIRKVFEGLAGRYDYEHLFLNNCSTDGTLAILREIASSDPRVKVLSYSRNFGGPKSAVVGFRYATGDAVIPYEANMKDPPELIPRFLELWEEGNKVVYGQRRRTGDSALMLAARRTFYRLAASLADEELLVDFGGFGVYDRKVIDEIAKVDDYKPYTRGLVAAIGFRRIGVEYDRRPRLKGRSSNNFASLFDFAVNGIISHSIAPIRFCTYLGLALSVLSVLSAITYALLKIFIWNFQAPGATTIVILVFFFSGVQLFFLGVLGEYIGAIHSQVRRKPFVIIEEKINVD